MTQDKRGEIGGDKNESNSSGAQTRCSCAFVFPMAQILLLSHMRGRVGDMDRVSEICSRHSITLIEVLPCAFVLLLGIDLLREDR